MINKGDLERVSLDNLADGVSEVRPDKATRKKNRRRYIHRCRRTCQNGKIDIYKKFYGASCNTEYKK